MPKWTDDEIEILRNAFSQGLNTVEIANLIPNHSSIAIRAMIDRLDLQLEKTYGKVTVKAVQEHIDNINAKNGHYMPIERGYIGLVRHEDGYSIIQYIDSNMSYCVWGSHLTLVGCYNVLKEYEENCLNKLGV